MHSHAHNEKCAIVEDVLILVVMEDALALSHGKLKPNYLFVLILVVMEDALAPVESATVVDSQYGS